MTNFVLLYTGGTMPESEEQVAEVMAAWGAWYGAMGESVVDGGNPFSNAMHVNADGAHEGAGTEPGVTGYTVISAESLEEAAAKCAKHPHITYGGQVSVHETFQM